MAQRTVALCNGKYIGIETIYTVVNGQQINIPEQLKDLRSKSQRNELFCPCGCGANLILVAGDQNLREQHFRLKDGSSNQNCTAVMEGRTSVDSKIILKCWFDEKIGSLKIESRVPIHAVDDINRKYEFTFLSRSKNIALSYCRDRSNLSDEKLSILRDNSKGIKLIHIVDYSNGSKCGQYPEGLMKIQDKQGYCLLLTLGKGGYNSAKLEAVFYIQDLDHLWQEVTLSNGFLKDYSISENGDVLYDEENLDVKVQLTKNDFLRNMEYEKEKRIEQEKQRVEAEKKAIAEQARLQEERNKRLQEAEQERRKQIEETEKRRKEAELKRKLEAEKQQEEIRQRDEEFKRNMESDFLQQEVQVRDKDGNRWIKCEFCGKKAKENEFTSYGGVGHINLGTCKECSTHNPEVKKKIEIKLNSNKNKYDDSVCPDCGGKLRERSGPYGRFLGCTNYPKCRYNRKIR